MTDPREIELLEEIRDLLQRQVANHERAIQNQESSIATQQEAVRYQRRTVRQAMLMILPLVGIVVALSIWVFTMLRRFP